MPQTYQTVDGFGYTLTGGSAKLIHAMSVSARASLLNELWNWQRVHWRQLFTDQYRGIRPERVGILL